MTLPKAYDPQQGYKYQLFTKHPDSRELEHCDYAVDKAEKEHLLKNYREAYRGQDISFRVIPLPKKYWVK